MPTAGDALDTVSLDTVRPGPDIASPAALVGDPARASMLTAWMGGRALTAGELAREAGITPQTASFARGPLQSSRTRGLSEDVPSIDNRYCRAGTHRAGTPHRCEITVLEAFGHNVSKYSASIGLRRYGPRLRVMRLLQRRDEPLQIIEILPDDLEHTIEREIAVLVNDQISQPGGAFQAIGECLVDSAFARQEVERLTGVSRSAKRIVDAYVHGEIHRILNGLLQIHQDRVRDVFVSM